MDNQNPENKYKFTLNQDQQYQNELIEKWAKSSPLRRTLLKGIPILILLFAIPITVRLSFQQQNIDSNASIKQTPTIIPTVSTPTAIPTLTLAPTNSPTSTPSSKKNEQKRY